jgi:hypothetical protein
MAKGIFQRRPSIQEMRTQAVSIALGCQWQRQEACIDKQVIERAHATFDILELRVSTFV